VALRESGQAPRQILIQWARQSVRTPRQTGHAFVRLPREHSRIPANLKHMVTQSTDRGGNHLTL
jgi:hypothetical protein